METRHNLPGHLTKVIGVLNRDPFSLVLYKRVTIMFRSRRKNATFEGVGTAHGSDGRSFDPVTFTTQLFSN